MDTRKMVGSYWRASLRRQGCNKSFVMEFRKNEPRLNLKIPFVLGCIHDFLATAGFSEIHDGISLWLLLLCTIRVQRISEEWLFPLALDHYGILKNVSLHKNSY